MGWPKLLVIGRHSQSFGNIKSVEERAKYSVPTFDYDITPLGERQSEITGVYCRNRFGFFDVYYTSYYKRSKRTMNIIYPGVKVYEDPRIAEAQRGIWHTMTQEEIEKYFPTEIIRKKREGYFHYRPPGGENWPDVELRIHSFLGTLSRDYENQKVFIVAHGHWLILFQRLIHHFSIEEAMDKYKNGIFDNASLTIYEGKKINGKSRLILKEENIVPWKGKM